MLAVTLTFSAPFDDVVTDPPWLAHLFLSWEVEYKRGQTGPSYSLDARQTGTREPSVCPRTPPPRISPVPVLPLYPPFTVFRCLREL